MGAILSEAQGGVVVVIVIPGSCLFIKPQLPALSLTLVVRHTLESPLSHCKYYNCEEVDVSKNFGSRCRINIHFYEQFA